MSNDRQRVTRQDTSSTARAGITRRQATALAASAVAAVVLPLPAAMAAHTLAPAPDCLPLNNDLGFACSHVAERLPLAWTHWQEASTRFAETMAQAVELTASRDIDAIMAYRTQPDFVAFDMASRRIRRFGEMTSWSEPRNDAERAIQARALGYSQAMTEAENFEVMRRLSVHVNKLQRDGLQARDHRLLRMRQQNLQHEYSTAFDRQPIHANQ